MDNPFKMLLDREKDSQKQELLLATVVSVTNDGLTMILDGESEATQKKYKFLTSAYPDPAAGDRVVVMQLSGTYIVLGRIGKSAPASGPYVRRSGDTMTGPLVLEGTRLDIDASDVVIGTRPESTSWVHAFQLRDALNKVYARILGYFGTDGRTGLQIYASRTVNGTTANNTLGLYLDEEGNASVSLDPVAWRKILDLGTNGALPIKVNQGGTGTTIANANRVFAGPSSGNAAAPSFRALTADDIPSISVSKVTGTMPINKGGSGQTGTTHTTTVSEILTAEEGWTVTSADYWQWGKLAMVQINIRTTQEVTMSTDTTIATIAAGKRPATASPAQVWLSTAYAAIISATGALRVGKGSTGTVAADSGFTFLAVYLLP